MGHIIIVHDITNMYNYVSIYCIFSSCSVKDCTCVR